MDLGHGKNRVPGGYPNIAHQSDFQSGTDAITVHCAHYWLVQVQKLTPNVALPAHLTGDYLRRSRAEFGEVGSGSEGSAFSGYQYRSHFRII